MWLEAVYLGHFRECFFFLFVHCPLSATTVVYLEPRARLLFLSFFCLSIQSNCTHLRFCRFCLIWPHVLDLMSPWPSGISLFASSISPCSRLTCFGNFTQLCKKRGKKVISAAVWIRKWVEKAERIILTRFRTCCSWPGFCKARKAQDIKREFIGQSQ